MNSAKFLSILVFFFSILFYQASEKKEHKFKFASHMPSKMEQVNIVWHKILCSCMTSLTGL